MKIILLLAALVVVVMADDSEFDISKDDDTEWEMFKVWSFDYRFYKHYITFVAVMDYGNSFINTYFTNIHIYIYVFIG